MKIIFSTVMCTLLMLPAAAQRPTMGWSSWNTYRVNISDSLIRKQAFAMTKNGLKEAGYEYINIDDGAFDGREPDGRLHAHATRFPQGLKPVVDYIHSLGLKAGTYSDAGRNTCGNYWDNDKGGVGIGLYLVRQIAEGQCGYVKVSSKPGEGSTFSLYLPREICQHC